MILIIIINYILLGIRIPIEMTRSSAVVALLNKEEEKE
jgi:hypothetical protein